ncbi:MAG: hypothetical protein NTW69_09855 [Chloroflexi bacterium]|nr:hypothetical protein [Chloroflexota bacterium]
MTTNSIPESEDIALEHSVEEPEKEEKRRRRLLLLLLLLLFLSCFCAVLFLRYLFKPAPLPELMSLPVEINYPPHYLYSVYGVNLPVGAAVSPDGKKLYVAETGGDRLIKIIEADSGRLLKEFMPPNTSPGERSPVYLAVDASGRVYVTDRLQHAIFIYTGDGEYLDTIIAPNLTLSAYISSQLGGLPQGTKYLYNIFQEGAWYQPAGATDWVSLPVPKHDGWSPLGLTITADGRMLVTNVVSEKSSIIEFPASVTSTENWTDFSPTFTTFGSYGEGDGQFLYPNDALVDSRGRYYSIDGNNARISVWDATQKFQYFFGSGTGEGAVSLPRGAYLDDRNRLFIVDAVGQNVKVYGVSGDQPEFLYAFGDLGVDDGQFNYPNDVVLFGTNIIYIVDRENNRVQVWSY